MNDIRVTLRGNVATEPKQLHFDDGNSITTFRLACNARRFDRGRQEWVDRGTTYVSVNCRRAMGLNAAGSLRKGQPVVVTGRLRERAWTANGRSGTSLQVEAETLGHDLSFGSTEFRRIVRTESAVTGSSREEEQMAETMARQAAEDEVSSGITDVTGLSVIEDGDELDPEFDLGPDEVEELVAELARPAMAH
jgi:single-strand DNA-binding protein